MPWAPRAITRPRGWATAYGGAGLQLLHSALYYQSFGLYVVAWMDAFGWSRVTVAGGYAIVTLVTGGLAPVHGWFLERFGPRRVVLVGLLVLGAGLLALARVDSLAGYYLASTLLAVGLTASGYLSVMAAVVAAFARRRGAALAIVGVGTSLGGVLVPLVAAALVVLGWRAALGGSALLFLVLGMPLALLLGSRPRPSHGGAVADADTPGEATGVSLATAVRSGAFWRLGLGFGTSMLLVATANVHLVPHLIDGVGLTLPTAGTVVALLTIMAVCGQVGGGLLADRVDTGLLARLTLLAHAGGFLALALATGTAGVVTFAVLHGLAWGARGPLLGAMYAEVFGSRRFASILGTAMALFMVGQLIGPLAAGAAADATGSYRAVIGAMAGLAAVAALVLGSRSVGGGREPGARAPRDVAPGDAPAGAAGR
jgi:MFS family permease